MANFIFNWATAALAAGTLDLSTGNYYAHLVTTVPVLGHSTSADLVLPTTSGYAPTVLTGLSYNTTRWTFDSFNFPKYNFVSAPKGVVICKRNGVVPATTDGIVCYSDFSNSIGQGISLQVGNYVVNLQFGTNGAIGFSYRYQYNSGAYVNTELVPKGLIYLIGSQNNTIPFADPTIPGGKIIGRYANVISNSIANRIRTDSVASTALPVEFGLDFGSLRIKPVDIGIYNYVATFSNPCTVSIYGSNNINNDFNTNWNNITFFDIIGSGVISTWANSWGFVNCTDIRSWQYLLFKISASNLTISEIEFYNSTIISPNLNIV